MHAAPQDADLIERRPERNEAVTADAAVGRLDPDHATKGRRLAHRTAGLRTERRRYRSRPDERRRAAGGAARHAGFIDWMHDASEGRKLGRRTHREFVAIRFSRD